MDTGGKLRTACVFLLSMKSVGLDIENIPFMTNKGHLLAAVRFIYQTTNIVITIKFCTEYIIHNIVHLFSIQRIKESTLRTIVMGMQQLTTLDQYFEYIDEINENTIKDVNDNIVLKCTKRKKFVSL